MSCPSIYRSRRKPSRNGKHPHYSWCEAPYFHPFVCKHLPVSAHALCTRREARRSLVADPAYGPLGELARRLPDWTSAHRSYTCGHPTRLAGPGRTIRVRMAKNEKSLVAFSGLYASSKSQPPGSAHFSLSV